MEKAIYNILINNAAVFAITGNRIYPLVIPQGIEKPAITYQSISGSPSNDKSGTSRLDVIKTDIDMWGENHLILMDLKEKVRAALDGFDDTNSGYTLNIIFEDEKDLFDDDSERFHIVQTYSIRLKR